ncbi:MAG: DUF393 domain-containing protein [Pseudomonadota bacterium]
MTDLKVYYDGSCPLCVREISIYRRRSDAEFVDVSDPHNVPTDLTAEQAMARFHVREGTTLHDGAGAFAALWRGSRGFRTLGRIAGLPGVRHALDVVYAGFLKVRPRFQRLAVRHWGAPRCETDTCR